MNALAVTEVRKERLDHGAAWSANAACDGRGVVPVPPK